MTVKRDAFGRIKRVIRNRDFRRAHLQGALRLVGIGEKEPTSFKGRIGVMVRRAFGLPAR